MKSFQGLPGLQTCKLRVFTKVQFHKNHSRALRPTSNRRTPWVTVSKASQNKPSRVRPLPCLQAVVVRPSADGGVLAAVPEYGEV